MIINNLIWVQTTQKTTTCKELILINIIYISNIKTFIKFKNIYTSYNPF
jgi:hypothetical protein